MSEEDEEHETMKFRSYSPVFIVIIAAGRSFTDNVKQTLRDSFCSKKSIERGSVWKHRADDNTMPTVMLIEKEQILKLYGPTFSKIPEFHWKN